MGSTGVRFSPPARRLWCCRRGAARKWHRRENQASLSERVAAFAAGFDLKAAPPLAIERARTAFIDTVGVMLAGSQEKAAEIVRDMVSMERAAPATGIVGSPLRSSPQLAALANGVAAHALDFDLTYTQGQLTAPLIPALLPLAEAYGATQAEVLAAYIVGFEVVSRLSRTNPNHNGGGLWHGTGTIGTIGAAAASARLLKLPAAAIPDALGIAVSLASGVNANYGTMTKPLHAGNAARNGIAAAMLGARGFTSSSTAIEGRGGFARTFARGLEWNAKPFGDLGQQFDLAVFGFQPKRYPCGGVIHTAIDAALLDPPGDRRGRRHHGDPRRDLEIRRRPRQAGLSARHGSRQVQSAIRGRLCAGEGRAQARRLRSARDRRSRGSRRWRRWCRCRSIRSSPTRARTIRRGSR